MTADTKAKAGTIVGIDIMEYHARDPQRLVAFYRDVLGLQPTDVDGQGRGAEFTLADGTTFGVWKPDESDAFSTARVMFAVPDIAAAVAEFRSRGATLSDPLQSSMCHMSFGQDPEGNQFVLHQRKN